MKKVIVSVSILFFAFSLVGCAALFNSGGGDISFSSNPSGAEVIVDGQSLGSTPVKIKLDRNTSHKVIIRKDGRENTYLINKKIGAGWIILDVAAGVVPVIIDAATGAWYSLTPKEVHAQLR